MLVIITKISDLLTVYYISFDLLKSKAFLKVLLAITPANQDLEQVHI